MNNRMKLARLVVVSIILTLSFEVSVFAQAKPNFRHITRDHGLSSNRILCITQDKFGFMWFGTEDGLTRYDGSDFEIYKRRADDEFSLSNNTINCIAEEPGSGNLWIGTPEGLDYYNRKENKFYRNPPGIHPQDSLSQKLHINDILIDHNGKLWISTRINSLFHYRTPGHRAVHYDYRKKIGITHQDVNCIYEDSDHTIWAGLRNNLCRFDPVTDKFTEFELPEDSVRVVAISEDSRKNLWISTRDHGVFRISADRTVKHFCKENYYLLSNRVYGIAEDEQGNIWMAVRDGGGIHYLDRAANSMMIFSSYLSDAKSLSSSALSTIYKDRNGNMWVGTSSNGIDYYDRHEKQFGHQQAGLKPDALMSNSVRSVYQDREGDIWIGTIDGGGLSKFDPLKRSFKNYKGDPQKPDALPDGYVLSITESATGKLIIGTYRKGIVIFDKQTEKFFTVKNSPEVTSGSKASIYHLSKDRYDSIWVASPTRVYTFDMRTNQLKERLKIPTAKSILDYSEDELYVITGGHGLYRLNRKTNVMTNYRENTSGTAAGLSSNFIHSITTDKQGVLWMATNQGITAFDPKTNIFSSYSMKDGLPSDIACGILVDDHGNVWISTVNGLAKFDPTAKKISTFDVHDGLQGNEFERHVCYKMQSGEMIFGGRNGFNYFHPDHIRANPLVPNVVITELQIFNKPVLPGVEDSPLTTHISQTEQFTLNYHQNVFAFEFVGISFTSPEKNQYAYILEGFDKEWNYSPASKRYATYTNLPAGTYTFRVKASNNDGLWNEQPASVEVNILPPPWKTSWAYVLYTLTAGLLIYLLMRYINMRKDFDMRLQVARIEKEKVEELNRMKVEFFTNISHEFKTPLTLIIGALKRITKTAQPNTSLDGELGYIQRNTTRLQNLISQLIDFRKIESKKLMPLYHQGDIVVFLKELLSVFQPIADENDIELVFDSTADKLTVFFDADKTEKIFYNLFSNAVKFTPANGSVSVLTSLYTEHNSVFICVRVTNTGSPIEQHVLNHLFETFHHTEQPNSFSQPGTGIGLAFAKELVSLLGGKITADSNPEDTSFTVMIPYIEKMIAEAATTSHASNAFEYSQELVKSLKLHYGTSGISGNAKGPVLLIVEDDRELNDFLCSVFAEEYKVVSAADGGAALDLAISVNPDLILSDIMMPGVTGIELCHQVKTDIAISHIPVILLTASDTNEQKIKGMEMGADVYIEKPFDVDFLKLQVKNVIQTRKAIRQAFAKKITPEPESITITSTDEEFVKKAISIVEANMDNCDFDVEAFVKEIGIGRSLLYRKIKALTDLPVNEFILNIRLKRAVQLLKDTDLTVSEIAFRVGFNSAKYFSACFKRFFRESPSHMAEKYRQRDGMKE